MVLLEQSQETVETMSHTVLALAERELIELPA
jgi:hypothetical protein